MRANFVVGQAEIIGATLILLLAKSISLTTARNCGIMNIEDIGHESAMDGKATTLFRWEEYIDTVYQHCGKRETHLRANSEARRDTLESTIAFFTTTYESKTS